MRCVKGRQKPVASRLWETPVVDVDLSFQFGCGVSRDGLCVLKLYLCQSVALYYGKR